ncbi:RNA polymerase sigma factor [Laedolimicola intestinihominis]|uniref:Sigma-70 family RNA polymerase sigma factor n=1 Tax=Laedolimicola intestinihominis TaxID=3133166 RepID=A0ABV1FGN6_9FIRM
MKKEELGELIMASEDAMYHVAKTLLYSDADCADAIQEAIVKAFSKLDTLKKDAYAKTWLMRILLNECYSVMRKEKRVVSLEDYRQEEKTEEQKDYSDLYEAIYRLPEEMRLSVTLYYLDGYSVREIAAMMETTESAVKNRLARARQRLKRELTERAAQ